MPTSGSSTAMSAPSDRLPAAFIANHHRLHNPDDPKLRATPATRSKRHSLFGAIIKPKQKSSQKIRKPPSTSGEGSSRRRDPVSNTWTREVQGGNLVAPRERSSSRPRRHSLGPTANRSTADPSADAQEPMVPDLPSHYLVQSEQDPAQKSGVHDEHDDKVLSLDSRPPSDLIREDVLGSHEAETPSSPSGSAQRTEMPPAVSGPLGQLGQSAPVTTTTAAADMAGGSDAAHGRQSSQRDGDRSIQERLPLAEPNDAVAGPVGSSIPPLTARSDSLWNGSSQGSWNLEDGPNFVPSDLPASASVPASQHLVAVAATGPSLPCPALVSVPPSKSNQFAVPERTASKPDSSESAAQGIPQLVRPPPLGTQPLGGSRAPPALNAATDTTTVVNSATRAAIGSSSSSMASLNIGQASPSRQSGPVSIRSLRGSLTPQAPSKSKLQGKGLTPRPADIRAAGREEDGESEGSGEDDEDLEARPRARKRPELSLLDFLSSEAPAAAGDVASGSPNVPSPQGRKRLAPLPDVLPASMPLLEAAKGAALPTTRGSVKTPVKARRRSIGNMVTRSQPASQHGSRRASTILTPSSPLGQSQGLDGEQGMNFLLQPSRSDGRSSEAIAEAASQHRHLSDSGSQGQRSSIATGKMREVDERERITKGNGESVFATSLAGARPAVHQTLAPRPTRDLSSGITLSIEPLTDDIVMFGSTQTSSNYSLSGTVVLTIPRPESASRRPSHDDSDVPPTSSTTLARAASIGDRASPTKARSAPTTHRHTASLAVPCPVDRTQAGESQMQPARPTTLDISTPPLNEGPAAALVASPLELATPDDSWLTRTQPASERQIPSVKVESLTVTFSGFALYADASGRYNAIKLASVSQELLRDGGCTCSAEDHESALDEDATTSQQLHPHRSEAKGPVRYDIEFDVAVPGWLPGSLRSRFGGTFYCLQAEAIIDGKQLRSASPSAELGWAMPPSLLFSEPFTDVGQRTMSGLVGEEDSASGSAPASLRSSVPSTTDPNGTVSSARSERPKSSWLGKRAKQLQLRTPKKSSASSVLPDTAAEESGGSQAGSQRGGQPVRIATEETGAGKASNVLVAGGKRKLQSHAVTIVIRRCRDVVPVPVARMALIGSDPHLPGLNLPLLGTNASLHPRLSAPVQPSFTGSTDRPAPEASLTQTESSNSFVTAAGQTPPITPSNSGPVSSNANDAPLASPLAPAADIVSRSFPIADNTEGSRRHGDLSSGLAAHHPTAPLGDAMAPLASPEGISQIRDEMIALFPPPSGALELPRDPAKRAEAAASLTSSTSSSQLPAHAMPRSGTQTSLLDLGNARSPPRTSSRGAPAPRSSAPMRHFLHRPVLHPPKELGIFASGKGASEGLPFSLTLSLPSHVQVSGPKSDTLSFGVQIEVAKTDAWNVVRELGGLRLRDMELVCLQTERHSSVPSRTFCAAFPVPPAPNKVAPHDLPSVAPSSKRSTQMASLSGSEARLRYGYDRDLVLNHLSLLKQGTAPDPVENNVERTRTTIVGPPPSTPPMPDDAAANASGFGRRPDVKGKEKSKDKAKDKGKGKAKASGQAEDGIDVHATTARQPETSSASEASVAPSRSLLPTETLSGRTHNIRAQASNSSLRGRTTAEASNHSAAATSGGASLSAPPVDVHNRSSSPASALPRMTHTTSGVLGVGISPSASRTGLPTSTSTNSAMPDAHEPATSEHGEASEASGSVRGTASRRRRVYANALSRLSNFASAMLDPGIEVDSSNDVLDPRGARIGNSGVVGDHGMPEDVNSRATYHFSGEDGEGVDLTRGRVRMTINLPLASADALIARSKGSAQLIPDFESPYVRIRHKLRVKLGFGLSHRSSREEHSWSQALVMCVPVRFTESPPKEVQDQFAPVLVQPVEPSGGFRGPGGSFRSATEWLNQPSLSSSLVPSAMGENSAGRSVGVPLLPAYTQLFREDGSRLADEGEDLPQYPGRMSVVGEIDLDQRDNARPVGPGRSPSLCQGRPVGTIPEDDTVAEQDGAATLSGDPLAAGGSASQSLQATPTGKNRVTPPSTSSGAFPALPSTPPGISASFSYASMFSEALEGGGGTSVVPTPMDRSTSLPGHRGLALRGTASVSPLKNSTSSSYLQPHSAPLGEGFGPSRPPMRQRSATSASVVSFSRIAPSEVLDEALLTNTVEDEEARRDAARAAAAGLEDEEEEEEEEEGTLLLGGALTDAEGSDAAIGSSRSSADEDQRGSHGPTVSSVTASDDTSNEEEDGDVGDDTVRPSTPDRGLAEPR